MEIGRKSIAPVCAQARDVCRALIQLGAALISMMTRSPNLQKDDGGSGSLDTGAPTPNPE